MGKRKLFGTDGIRGKANIYPMTCEVAMALGRAVTYYFKKTSGKNKQPLIVLGKDTRLSCYMLELAFSSGVCSQGGRVVLTGPLPTPGVAFVTGSMRADAGVMISASHNQYEDNGIKIFDGEGYKLPDSVELELEQMILNPELIPAVAGSELGRATRLDEVIGRYIVQVKNTFPQVYNLSGTRMVLDCANGASYKVGPMIFEELGAEVICIGDNPNGQNINEDCGSLYPEKCQEKVVEYRADLGICLDGDADRLIVIDQNGKIIDGDMIIGISAKLMLDKGEIKKGDTVVGTVMTNLGLEKYLESIGLKLHRTQVGDRYIMEYLKESGAILGGEPSGHLIFKNYATTGDGILAALIVMECLKRYQKPIGKLVSDIKLYPQILKNVKVEKKIPFDEVPGLQNAVKTIENNFAGKGRVLLRYSGTENLCRIMVEGEDFQEVEKVCEALVKVVKRELV